MRIESEVGGGVVATGATEDRAAHCHATRDHMQPRRDRPSGTSTVPPQATSPRKKKSTSLLGRLQARPMNAAV